MKLIFLSVAITLTVAVNVAAQSAKPVEAKATTAVSITSSTTPIELARIALVEQGGENFKTLKSMVLRGSVDL